MKQTSVILGDPLARKSFLHLSQLSVHKKFLYTGMKQTSVILGDPMAKKTFLHLSQLSVQKNFFTPE